MLNLVDVGRSVKLIIELHVLWSWVVEIHICSELGVLT